MARDRTSTLPIRRRSTLTPFFGEDFGSSSPVGMMRRMQEDIGRLMESFWQGDPASTATWAPAVDVYEQGNEWIVKADLPGVDPQDIDLQVSNDSLRISAETRSEEEKQEKGYFRAERRFGAFERVIPLPNGVRADDVQAQFRNGVLEVHLPKAKEAQYRRISIQSGDHNGHRGGPR